MTRLAVRKITTNTQRGFPQTYTVFLDADLPRMTGMWGGLIFAAKCGEKCLIVLIILSLKVAAKLSLRKAMLRAVKAAPTIASGLVISARPRMKITRMK
uniref:Uncharacterized protein n=1 Tax=Noccaea caerulescens TaxID=107243 RepID=A0A1J3E6F8_NOCCA